MRAVNLLPRKASSQKFVVDRTLVIAAAVTMVVLAAVVGGFFMEKANAASAKQQAAAAQEALARAQSQQPKTGPAPARLQIPVVLSQQEPWHLALDSALSTRVPWDSLLQKLEYVVPDRISLTSVTLGSSSGASGGPITLGGNAYSQGDIANFLSMLSRVPDVSQVTLVSSATNIGTNVITFQITAQLVFAGTAVPPVSATTTPTGG